jgi:prephenate dehydratase
MAETVEKVDYYYTSAPNKPGEGARLLGVLRQAGVSLVALHAFPSGRKAQVDFVPADAAAFRAAAKAGKIKLSKPKTAFLVQGDDRVGAMADLLGRLAAAKINVTAVTGICAGMARYGAILWVKPRDVTRAAGALGAL